MKQECTSQPRQSCRKVPRQSCRTVYQTMCAGGRGGWGARHRQKRTIGHIKNFLAGLLGKGNGGGGHRGGRGGGGNCRSVPKQHCSTKYENQCSTRNEQS